MTQHQKTEGLRLKHGGKLVLTRWVYDKAAEKGEYQSQDVTQQCMRFLFEPIQLGSKVQLRDLFLLAQIHQTEISSLFGLWSPQFIAEALTPHMPSALELGRDALDYVEVYHVFEETETLLEGVTRPYFHGVGIQQPADYTDGSVLWKKGERIPWSLSFSKVWQFVDLPLRINSRSVLCRQDGTTIDLPAPRITLGSLIHAIFWELSFYGPPKKRDKLGKRLHKRCRKGHHKAS